MTKQIGDLRFLGHVPSFPSYRPTTAWLRHGTFATWLAKAARPNMFVELGTHYGFSYFAFCQAIAEVQADTKCFAIDTWEGDDHAGFYDDSIFRNVQVENQRYKDISTLLRKTFDEAVTQFEDGSIDLLHIDGRHRYDDVRHDFETWQPKLASSSVVLFHDTCVERPGFGVKRYWSELEAQYPSLNFRFQNGLGVIFVGDDHPTEISALKLIAESENGQKICNALFYSYSQIYVDAIKSGDVKKELKQREVETRRLERSMEQINGVVDRTDKTILQLNTKLNNRRANEQVTVARLSEEIARLGEEVVALRRRPTRALRDLATHHLMKKLAKAPLPLSARTRDRFRRSSEKRNPNDAQPRYTARGHLVEIGAPDASQAADMQGLITSGVNAITKARSEGFGHALTEFRDFADRVAARNDAQEDLKSLHFLVVRDAPSWQGPVIGPSDAAGVHRDRSNTVIYTALFGNYDRLPAIHTVANGLEFVCFSDHDIVADGWKTVKVARPHADDNLAAKYFKVHPHETFKDKDFSLFVDANTVFCGRVDSFLDRWLSAVSANRVGSHFVLMHQ